MTPPPFRLTVAALALLAVFASPAMAGEKAPLPRFAALRSNEVNLRTGPGTQYPVEWVFLRRALPVEIVAEYGQWRKVRDVDGSEGWVHRSLLTGKRWAMITGGVRTLRREPDETSPPVLRAEPGVLGKLLACQGAWCRLEIEGRKGWLPRREVWGVYAGEAIK